MRELAILSFVTLDGVMQAPKFREEDTSNGFQQGGWADPHWDQVMEQVGKEAMSAPYDVLLGRKTYDSFAENFSKLDKEHPLNRATKYVATSDPSTLKWQNSKGLSGDIATEVAQLKKQEGPLIQVHGSTQLIQTLLSHDLIDEFRLWTFPVLVGTGKRLFAEVSLPRPLKLIKSEAGPSGVIMGIYRCL